MELNHLSNFGGVYKNLHIPALVIGGVSVLIALVLSFLLILQHLRSYTNPAIISLWNSRFSIICDILRNCYEAFALYSFGSYLAACLGGEERVAELLENGANKQLSEQLLKEEEKERAPHRRSFLDFFCHPSVLGKYLYTIVKFGLVQYTLCAFLALLLELFGVYGDGEFQLYYGYPYIAVVLNFSQMWALYCLVQFYNVTHHRLQAIKPLAKFISFKAIVFATWWQGVGIAIICYFGILPKEGKIQNGIQDFLICIEMAIAAVAHVYVFSAKPYRFLSVSEYGKVTSLETTTKVKINESGKGRPTSVEQEETRVESPGTSITKSVQDVVLGSGEHVVKDVALTISQAIEPVEKGVTKIQETFHHISFGSDKEKEHKVEVDEYITENVVGDDPHIISSKMEINNGNLQ
uniref:Protein LAZ1 homolog 2 isoform X5 n=1 Tax=Elaeis guineensis var. tenera TaxID=51953 RepID=A0A6I9S562_ELAGV|nr:protein LAZ1 homolog 2 isoform X5 [Elaeis guineensis]